MNRRHPVGLVALAATLTLGGQALADSQLVNLGNFEVFGFYGHPSNTHITIPFGAGWQITDIDFIDVTVASDGASNLLNEFVVSVNDQPFPTGYWDSTIPGAPAAPGLLGPISTPFSLPGEFGSGPFTATTNSLYIEVYDRFDEGDTRDYSGSGQILITYNVPAPGALALLGLSGLIARRRRSRA